jgi:hypothetical protein
LDSEDFRTDRQSDFNRREFDSMKQRFTIEFVAPVDSHTDGGSSLVGGFLLRFGLNQKR